MYHNFSDKFFINVTSVLWLMFIVTICIIVSQQGQSHTVTPNYLDAANLWIHGKDLYAGNTGRGFVYLPQSAILFIPFAYLAQFSFTIAEISWRLVSLLLLVLAIWRLSNLVEKKYIAKTFFIVTFVTLPLIFSNARNGQFNTIIEVMMLFAVCSVAKERWSQVVFYLALGFALKPTMIVLLLLLCGLYRKLWLRLFMGLIAIFVFPFFTQFPSYVINQYINSIYMLQTVSAIGSNTHEWAQLFSLLRQLKLTFSPMLQDVIRAIAAVFALYCSILVKQKFNKYYVAIFLYTLASCYLMLFNPRTEGCNYGIVAPAIGVFISLFSAYNYKKLMWLSIFIVCGLIMSGHFSFAANNNAYDLWSAPFFTLIFITVVIIQSCKQKNFSENNSYFILQR